MSSVAAAETHRNGSGWSESFSEERMAVLLFLAGLHPSPAEGEFGRSVEGLYSWVIMEDKGQTIKKQSAH